MVVFSFESNVMLTAAISQQKLHMETGWHCRNSQHVKNLQCITQKRTDLEIKCKSLLRIK